MLTGADPAFCAGLDLKELAAGGEALRETGAAGGTRRRQRGPFPEMATPVIGAVNGVAITGGFELALACDFLVASERARFADTHARVGIMPGWGLTVLLPEAIGVRRAKEMSTTGNFLDADDRARLGPREPRRARTTSCSRSPASWPPTSRRSTVGPCARCSRPTTRARCATAPGRGSSSARWPAAGRARGLDPAALEASRQAVVARGRTQL